MRAGSRLVCEFLSMDLQVKLKLVLLNKKTMKIVVLLISISI